MTLKPNQRIDVKMAESTEATSYSSRVEDISDDQVLIAAPMDKGHVMPIRPGEQIWLEFWESDPKVQGRYRGAYTVERRVMDGNIPLLWVTLRGQWRRIQQRDYVRVDVLLKGRIAGFSKEDPQEEAQCAILNLSGGGAMFRSDIQIAKGSKVLLGIPLDNELITTSGTVVRATHTDGSVVYGVVFEDIQETDRQQIIQYVFQRQIEQRRRGL